MSQQFNITSSIVINQPVQTVWDNTANDFGNISQWIASVAEVEFDTTQGDGAGQVRTCISPFGATKETMVTYDEETHSFGYQIEGLPPFVAKGVNTWTARSVDANATELTWDFAVTTVDDVDADMLAGFKGQMSPLFAEGQEELKHWLETGEQHPRKVAATQMNS